MQSSETKFCEYCLKQKPLSDFRRCTRSEARQRQCRECRNATDRARKARKRAARDHRRMSHALTKLKNEPRNDRLRFIAGEMFKQFGGVEGFMDAWRTYQTKALKQGGFPAFRCFAVVLRLVEYCEELRRPTSQLSDEELNLSLKDQLKGMMVQHPDVAIEAARELGLKLEPVSGQQSSPLPSALGLES